MIRIKEIFVIISVFIIITFIFVCFDLGAQWEGLKKSKSIFNWVYISLISYRVLIYSVPAFILSKAKRTNTLNQSFKTQFAVYIAFKMLISVLAIDYVFSLEIFNAVDSFVLVSGYIFAFIYERKNLHKG